MYFADAVNGDDRNDGLTPSSAFATLERINESELLPGTTVALKSGSIFTGTLKPKNGGTVDKPVRITSYGEGPLPIINGNGAENAVEIRNLSYIEVSNLEIINVTSDIYTPRRGVFVCCGENGGEYRGITIKNLYVHNIVTSFGREAGGIIVWCGPADSPVSFDGVTVTGCTVCDTGAQGITFSSAYSYRVGIDWTDLPYTPSHNIRITDNYIARCGGDGIFQSCAESPIIEHNTVAMCCFAGNTPYAGIWPHNSQNAVMRENEAFGCVLIAGDGQGYDVDINCTDTVVSDNLSHHNDGGFILLCTSGDIGGYNNGITVERNISIDDSGQIFTLSGPIKNIKISNNSILVEKNIHTRLIGTYQWGERGGGPENVTVSDNYIYMNTDGENRFFNTPPRFTGNSFGGSYGYKNLNDTSFTSLKAVPFDKSKYLIIKRTGGNENEQTGSIF